MPLLKRKAFAYVTNGDRLLVFRHLNSPEAGIQVPAGTIRPGEAPDAAVVREAREETGLSDLALVRFLGERRWEMTGEGIDEIHDRFFYHLRCGGEPPAIWRHQEDDPSDGSDGPIPFEHFWARLPDEVPPLIAGLDALLAELVESLRRNGAIA
jgi:8-oxo-dGTP pyrophosphatase MutT (NUDIX family)